jgi:hypothetical protein
MDALGETNPSRRRIAISFLAAGGIASSSFPDLRKKRWGCFAGISTDDAVFITGQEIVVGGGRCRIA